MSKRDLSRRIEQLERLLPRCAKHDQLEVFIMRKDESRLTEAVNCKNCRGNLLFVISMTEQAAPVEPLMSDDDCPVTILEAEPVPILGRDSRPTAAPELPRLGTPLPPAPWEVGTSESYQIDRPLNWNK